jgi:hypothetical protein
VKNVGLGMRLAALGLALLASGCGGNGVTIDPASVSSARIGVGSAATMAAGAPGKPGAVLGLIASSFLLSDSTIGYQSARDGIQAQMALFISTAERQNAVFALIEDLGSALQVDINDLLNRSNNRQETLDTYTTALQDLLQKAVEKQNELDDEASGIRDELRTVRRASASKQGDINQALREQDYTTAGSMQEELLVLQADESRLNAQVEQLDGQADLLGELIDIGTIRWTAMTSNREALVAGIRVVDVPGVEDLGVIRDETSQERRARTSGDGIFGGTE